MNRETINQLLVKYPKYTQKLFCRGFLITNSSYIPLDGYPFFGLWSCNQTGNVRIYTHPETHYFSYKSSEGNWLGLIGHAYDPVRMISDENEILRALSMAEDRKVFFEIVSELTGVYIIFKTDGDTISFLTDPVGLQSVFYSGIEETFYISSHSNLIGDLLGYKHDKYVDALCRAKTFKYFGNQLPGNITQFSEVKRCVPNYLVSINENISCKRFYWPHTLRLSKQEIEDRLITLMGNSLKLIADKWKRPAISLTGGCDSKTTLACASGIFEKFRYFSYNSMPNEVPDVEAAKQICAGLGLDYKSYQIPYSDEEIEDIEIIRAIILWNCGDVCPNNTSDVRKRAYLAKVTDFDVDVKSWASEIGRSRYTKRYNGRCDFGRKPSPRVCTTFYKFLFFNRVLVNRTDAVFEEYLSNFFEAAKEDSIPWQDQFYWEWHWPSRDGIALTGEHMYSGDITVPYNNRKILELLLSIPEEDRITDALYSDIRLHLCPEIDSATPMIVDVNHTKTRARLENLYYKMNTLLPY